MAATVTMQVEAECASRRFTAGCAAFDFRRVIASTLQNGSDDQTENESQNETERFHGAVIS